MKDKLTGMINQMVEDYRKDKRYDHMAYVTNGIKGMTEVAYVICNGLKNKNAKTEAVEAVKSAICEINDLDTAIAMTVDAILSLHP